MLILPSANRDYSGASADLVAAGLAVFSQAGSPASRSCCRS
jgi:hypothetical protein